MVEAAEAAEERWRRRSIVQLKEANVLTGSTFDLLSRRDSVDGSEMGDLDLDNDDE